MGETNIMEINYKMVMIYAFFAIITLTSCLITSKISYINGKIVLCEELGGVYTTEGCISCEDSGREWLNGECAIRYSVPNINIFTTTMQGG